MLMLLLAKTKTFYLCATTTYLKVTFAFQQSWDARGFRAYDDIVLVRRRRRPGNKTSFDDLYSIWSFALLGIPSVVHAFGPAAGVGVI
jgi:hypothetical protein